MADQINIHISDHAVVRWLERHHRIDLEPLRKRVACQPANGGFARDKMLIRSMDEGEVDLLRDEILAEVHAAMRGYDVGRQMEMQSIQFGKLVIIMSPHAGGRSVATIIGPDMEYGNPLWSITCKPKGVFEIPTRLPKPAGPEHTAFDVTTSEQEGLSPDDVYRTSEELGQR